ncbi:hypothetical protein C8R46DRAFT_372577 [Mycena filopes]|nr:hypothetical protein C8R46DRAFT_372577 [Mycena filopes]
MREFWISFLRLLISMALARIRTIWAFFRGCGDCKRGIWMVAFGRILPTDQLFSFALRPLHKFQQFVQPPIASSTHTPESFIIAFACDSDPPPWVLTPPSRQLSPSSGRFSLLVSKLLPTLDQATASGTSEEQETVFCGPLNWRLAGTDD